MFTPVEEIVGDDEEDTQLLNEMVEMARNYIASHKWHLPISAMYLVFGIGGIAAVFLVEFEGKIGGTDDRLWIVVGDLPPAYMIVVEDDTAQQALEAYCQLMDDWIAAVSTSGHFGEVFPVSAPPTQEHADMLHDRIEYLRNEIVPNVPADSVDA
jgi:hypothetical protein